MSDIFLYEMYSYRYTTYYDINRLSLYKYHVPWETVRVLVSLNVQTLVLLNRWPTRINHNLYHFSFKSIEFILYNTLHTWMNITMTRSKNRAKTPIGILGISIHVWVGSILGKNCLRMNPEICCKKSDNTCTIDVLFQ